MRSTPYPAAAEQDWARRVIDELHLPFRTDIDGLLALVGQRVGRPLLVVPTDEPVVNYRSPIEREIECAAMALARHISPSPHHGHIRLEAPCVMP